ILRGGRPMRARLLMGCLTLGWVWTVLPAVGADERPIKSSDLQVLKPEGDDKNPPARALLHRYLLDQARRHFDARRQAIAAIKTPEDISRRQKELRAFFLRSLGDLPERTPLNPRVVGTIRRDGYHIDKILFES